MTLLFFQNCVSPHQMPYIKELVHMQGVDKVILITPRIVYDERAEMGWENNDLLKDKGLEFHLTPSIEDVKCLLSVDDSLVCLFSGIRADDDVFVWFRLSLTYPVKRYIVTEAPFTYHKPLWMHYVRFYLQDYRFVKDIKGVFAIGEQAVDYYKSISNRWNVFPFQYVTEKIKRTLPVPTGNLQLLFVGSLSPRKNVGMVIEAIKGIRNVEFTIVGDGEQRQQLEQEAGKIDTVCRFVGTKPMGEISTVMQRHDVLILPSLHDGWGAVVNEAIGLGLYVIVSDRCGAKALIKNSDIGLVFKSNNVISLQNSINQCKERKNELRKKLLPRIEGADVISGKKVAAYFMNCLNM